MASRILHKQLRIGGMTCINCQNKIERKLRDTGGVLEATVSYRKGTARVAYNAAVISLRDIIAVIEDLDYQVLPEKGAPQPDISRTVGILLIIVSLYMLLQRFGILNLLAPNQLADTTMGYGMLFVIGLLTSVHCIAMCGGINLSQCIPRGPADRAGGGAASTVMPSILYNLGRVVSYTAIGFLLGLLGLLLGGGSAAGPSTLLQGILKLIAGALMVVMGLNMLKLFPWLRALTIRPPRFMAAKIATQKANSKRPLVVGLLNGLMPCGPLQSMQIVALASGSPLAGALSMFLFSLGTVPLMLGLGALVSALGKRFTHAVMNVGAVLVVVLGLAMLSQGGSLSGLLQPDSLFLLIVIFCVLGVAASLPFRSGVCRLACLAAAVCAVVYIAAAWGGWSGSPAEADGEGKAELADGIQVVTSTLSPGRYPDITVQAGTPVRWVIDAPAGSITGCNYKMLIQEYGIVHTFQEGENVIEFTPTQPGTISYSCWMGMLHGSIFVTDGDASDGDGSAAVQTEAEPFETSPYPGEALSAYGTGASCCA